VGHTIVLKKPKVLRKTNEEKLSIEITLFLVLIMKEVKKKKGISSLRLSVCVSMSVFVVCLKKNENSSTGRWRDSLMSCAASNCNDPANL
jgi:hypothetical protein